MPRCRRERKLLPGLTTKEAEMFGSLENTTRAPFGSGMPHSDDGGLSQVIIERWESDGGAVERHLPLA
jgi:hypothetical protein